MDRKKNLKRNKKLINRCDLMLIIQFNGVFWFFGFLVFGVYCRGFRDMVKMRLITRTYEFQRE